MNLFKKHLRQINFANCPNQAFASSKICDSQYRFLNSRYSNPFPGYLNTGIGSPRKIKVFVLYWQCLHISDNLKRLFFIYFFKYVNI